MPFELNSVKKIIIKNGTIAKHIDKFPLFYLFVLSEITGLSMSALVVRFNAKKFVTNFKPHDKILDNS